MAGKKPFLLRVDPKVLEAVRRWADDDLRSVNGQIEWILRWALATGGRLKPPAPGSPQVSPQEPPGEGARRRR